MATVHFHGEPAHTIGDLPALGTTLPNISLVDATLADITNDTIAGTRVIFNVFPSIDTGVCATSVRRFNEEAAGLDNTTVVCVSHDLPFALGRFCGAEGINNVVVGSAFRSSFGADFGLTLTTRPWPACWPAPSLWPTPLERLCTPNSLKRSVRNPTTRPPSPP